MTVHDTFQLVWILAGWFLWPMVVYIRAKYFKRKDPAAARSAAVIAFVVSTGLGILFTDAVSVSTHRRGAGWIVSCVWIAIPLLWLLLGVVQARWIRPREGESAAEQAVAADDPAAGTL
jgi:hypothetical protein